MGLDMSKILFSVYTYV